MTSGSNTLPFNCRQFRSAHWANLNTIVRQAVRLPQPWVRRVRSRTVANVDSIGFVFDFYNCERLRQALAYQTPQSSPGGYDVWGASHQ